MIEGGDERLQYTQYEAMNLTRAREGVHTVMIDAKAQSKYPNLSPNPVRTESISRLALVMISPAPTRSKNA